ncbi:ethanolamine ammonia-lyase subunit EutC [Streptomyces sp. NBC_00234]|uniref:ethanolamine ammonia-lyase subunit EutC n=1 Tax=Streptomyces sp. NBC_00234 TaxID=2903638 RepID=UPI002E2BCA35|nr:ethanolamine ammonia-lyase subunit EutC [Streptomyces sp. NBC_00234]
MNDAESPDLWDPLRRYTPARVGLGRSGAALPVRRLLEFQLAHAQARDAVHLPVDFRSVREAADGLPVVEVRSSAPDRTTYLRRPDLGRRVHPDDLALLPEPDGCELVVVVADGLSAAAVHRHAGPLLTELRPRLAAFGAVPVVLASQARVAIGDEIGERVGARLAVVLVGERPGLSAADSLGVYLTYAPRVGRRDSERNCLSNIHPPTGLGHEAAARALASLITRSLRLGLTGVGLQDDEGPPPIGPAR